MALRPVNINPDQLNENKPVGALRNLAGIASQALLAPLRVAEFPAQVIRSGLKTIVGEEGLQPRIPGRDQRFPSEQLEEILDPGAKEAGALGQAARFVAGEAPFAARAGINTLGKAGKYAYEAGKRYLGASAGSTAGALPGQVLGSQGLAELGSIAGGIAGATAAGTKTRRPSQILHEAEESALESARNKRLSNLIDEAKPSALQKEQELRNSVLRHPKNKAHFEDVKNQQLNSIKDEMHLYRNKIKELSERARPLYDEAEVLAKRVRAPADSLQRSIKQAKRDIKIGLTSSDSAEVRRNIKSVENIIRKSEKNGVKSTSALLSEAKLLKKRFNNQIYPEINKNTLSLTPEPTKNFKNAMAPVIGSLHDFIEEAGGPEHARYYRAAEDASREANLLRTREKSFNKSRKEELANINKIKFEDEHKTLFGKLSPYGVGAGIGGTVGKLAGAGYLGAGVAGAAGVGAQKAAQTIGREVSSARKLGKEYPNIYKQEKAAIINQARENLPTAIRTVAQQPRRIGQQGTGLRAVTIRPEDLEFV
jgi:hypothetical protein